MVKKDTVILLRAFGDFAIAVNTVKDSERAEMIEFIASKHLEIFYNAIPVSFRPENTKIIFYDFGITKGLFRSFTDRYLISIETLKELFSLRSVIKKRKAVTENFYLEQKKRRFLPSFFSGHSLGYIGDERNVYDAFCTFFQSPMQRQLFDFDLPLVKPNILVIPDARVKARSIPEAVIEKVRRGYEPQQATVTTAFFRSAPADFSGTVTCYRNFEELVALLLTADLVIGPDSMPIHLCQLLRRPHYIVYPEQLVTEWFFTPFAMHHHAYFSFEELSGRNTFLPNQ